MPLFSVSLLFSLQVEALDQPEPVRELAIHVLSAADQSEARTKGEDIGKAREIAYRNVNGEPVRDSFAGVVEVQHLFDDHLFDGMEVAYWCYRGERLILEEGWTTVEARSDGES